MEENCQYGIWKNRLPFHIMPCRSVRIFFGFVGKSFVRLGYRDRLPTNQTPHELSFTAVFTSISFRQRTRWSGTFQTNSKCRSSVARLFSSITPPTASFRTSEEPCSCFTNCTPLLYMQVRLVWLDYGFVPNGLNFWNPNLSYFWMKKINAPQFTLAILFWTREYLQINF